MGFIIRRGDRPPALLLVSFFLLSTCLLACASFTATVYRKLGRIIGNKLGFAMGRRFTTTMVERKPTCDTYKGLFF